MLILKIETMELQHHTVGRGTKSWVVTSDTNQESHLRPVAER